MAYGPYLIFDGLVGPTWIDDLFFSHTNKKKKFKYFVAYFLKIFFFIYISLNTNK